MMIPEKNRKEYCNYLFQEGACYAKKDYNLATHPEIDVPNLQVIKREKLIAAGYKEFDVLNAIAWDGKQKRLFVTGKLWSKLYEIKLHPMKERLDPQSIEHFCMRPPVHISKPEIWKLKELLTFKKHSSRAMLGLCESLFT